MPHHIQGFAEIRARKALQESGLPHDGPLTRANSTRNEVFLARDHVIRFNQMPNKRLSREATICELLPHSEWTPDVVAYGGRPGADYLIVSRRPGVSLSRCWPQMSRAQRRDAIQQFTEHLKEIHELSACGLPEIHETPHLLCGRSPVRPLVEGLDKLAAIKSMDSGLAREAKELVLDLADAIDDYNESRLIHGDLTFENILWDGHQITAIVDFEWCRGGPPDLDLDVLARYFSIPQAHVSEEAERWQHTEDYFQVPGWMEEVYPELFAHPRLADRLLIYAMAFEVRDALACPPPENKRDLSELHPYHRLDHLVATGGHASELIEHLEPSFTNV